MTVWLVYGGWMQDDTVLEGVFSSADKALRFINEELRKKHPDMGKLYGYGTEIVAWEIDGRRIQADLD